MLKLSPRKIGNIGETIVAELLPGANHINKNGDKNLPYDILWNGIKIDVKTSITEMGNPLFRVHIGQQNQGVILVFVLLRDNKQYFWIDRYSNRVMQTKYFEDSIRPASLPLRISNLHNTEAEIIIRNTKYKSIALHEKDYEELNNIRRVWIEQHKVDISLAKMIKIAMEEYKLALGA